MHIVLGGRQGVTPEMALRLDELFSIGPELWPNMHQAYDLWRARESATSSSRSKPCARRRRSKRAVTSMAKLREKAIGASDLLEYLRAFSDFSFELQTLELLRLLGLECSHGGLYSDPVTGKPREFDIRAIARTERRTVRLSIECKNLRSNFPLLVSCVPRSEVESYNDYIFLEDTNSVDYIRTAGRTSRATTHTVTGPDGLYKIGESVGKSLAQVGRSGERDNPIVATDSGVFEKWAQCLSCANDLVEQAYRAELQSESLPRITAIVPLLVVPDGQLWRVQYGPNGEMHSEPEQTQHCSYFVGKQYTFPNMTGVLSYRISHIEIVTHQGLANFVRDCLNNEDAMAATIFRNSKVYAERQNDGTS